MQSINEYEKFLLDNIYFLYSAPTNQILTTSLRYLKPNIPIDPYEYLTKYIVDHWDERHEYIDEDDDGELLDPEGIRASLQYTASSIYGTLEKWERDVRRLRLQEGETDIFLCERCGRIHPIGRRTQLNLRDITTKTLCDSCAKQVYAHCDHCKRLTTRVYARTNILNADGDVVSICSPCAKEILTQCRNCRRVILKVNEMEVEVEGIKIKACIQCKHRLVRECEECGESFPFINRIEHHGGEGSYCDKCIFTESGYNSHVYKPSVLHFKTTKSEVRRSNTMFFGLELECELGKRADKVSFARTLKQDYTYKDMYVVHDGSMDYGIEVVLMPFSDLWYKHNKKWLETLYDRMYALGGRFNRPKVGLHIHTSKAAWSQSQIYKIMRFCYAPENARVLERFFGRGECQHSRKSEYEYSGAVSVAKNGKNYDNEHHYNMINMSTGTTVEFRMFRGAKSINRVFSYLDFIRVLHEFTLETGLQYISMANFILFVNKSKKYKSIQPYFKEVK